MSAAPMTTSAALRFRSWPISEAAALEPALQSAGLKLPAKKIDGTSPGSMGDALSDALVSVGPAGRGGTGSFISDNGLIITNHHVALDAVRQASSTEHDYLNDGFVARSREEEIMGKDYEVWITLSIEDVSEQLVEARSELDPLKRANLVRDKRLEIARAAEQLLAPPGSAKASSIRCEVQEMWPDRTYTLFRYERLRDVRIVYVPPFSLGCFGGDTDNFEWPRHTADFTLLRAYVAPDGSAAEPSAENVPYAPQTFLRAAPEGASEGDFCFLLGFPGSTMRYAPSSRLAYSDEVAVPALVADFGAKLALIAEHATDRASSLKLAAAKKGLANEHKRSLGKNVMMRKLRLLEERKAEEAALVAAAPEAAAPLSRLEGIYATLRANAPLDDALDLMGGIYHGSTLLATARALHEASLEAAKPDGERETAYRSRNLPFLVKRLTKRLFDLLPAHEAALLRRAVAAAVRLPLGLLPADVDALGALADDLEARGMAALPPIGALSAEDLAAIVEGRSPPPADDVTLHVAAALYPAYTGARDTTRALLAERDQHLAALLELQRAHAPVEEVFYPDANGCLRLSAGHVEGYQAADAVRHTPLTTLAGLVDKHLEATLAGGQAVDPITGQHDYAAPARLIEGCLANPDVAATPVCVCYSTDTVGGNSGSPVLDAHGRFIAINFDRQRQGLMNEFKWSHDYSRSIGTDVRYILFLVGQYDGAQWLVDEMVK